VHKAAEVCFQALVQAFRLTIGLGMVCGVVTQLNTRQLEKFSPKSACKDPVTVRHNSCRQPMKLKDVVHKSLSNHLGSEQVSQGNEVVALGK
jgi:hypothetical protein